MTETLEELATRLAKEMPEWPENRFAGLYEVPVRPKEVTWRWGSGGWAARPSGTGDEFGHVKEDDWWKARQKVLYPTILKAFQLIAYDNGGIHRYRGTDDQEREAIWWLTEDDGKAFPLPAIEAWLSTLSEEDLDTITSGEESEVKAIMASAPKGTGDLLNEYFNGPSRRHPCN